MSETQDWVPTLSTYEAEAIAAEGWRQRHPPVSDAERLAKTMSQRVGDFDAKVDRGTFYLVKCVRCSLSGTISIPDSEHARCPRCSRVPLEEWQMRGWAGLLPPEPKRKPLRVWTVDTTDDIPYVTATEDGEGVCVDDDVDDTPELSIDALVREVNASVTNIERDGEPEPEEAVEEELEIVEDNDE